MKVADLRKYRKNVEALEAIDRLLNNKIVADTVQGSHGAPDYGVVHRRIEGFTQDKGTVALLKAKSNLLREQNAIRTLINGIKERRIYEALYYYCISEEYVSPSWECVAARLGEDSAQALRVAVERHLKNNF